MRVAYQAEGGPREIAKVPGVNAETALALLIDSDGDGLSDSSEALSGSNPFLMDSDSDGISDSADNCPLVANTDQLNADGDGAGNACDDDDDGDGIADLDEVGLFDQASVATLFVSGDDGYEAYFNGCR